MVVELVYLQIFWHNCFILLDYISTRTYDCNLFHRLGSKFGEYVQIYEKTTYKMKVRAVGALTLRTSGKVQGVF